MFWRKRTTPVDVVKSYVAALNARDAAGMKALLHPECTFVDSQGYSVEGYEDSVAAVDAFLALDDGFKMHVESAVLRGEDILMRGYTEARDPRLATDTLWTARVEDGKVKYWQSFGSPDSPALAHLLMPEKARPAPEATA